LNRNLTRNLDTLPQLWVTLQDSRRIDKQSGDTVINFTVTLSVGDIVLFNAKNYEIMSNPNRGKTRLVLPTRPRRTAEGTMFENMLDYNWFWMQPIWNAVQKSDWFKRWPDLMPLETLTPHKPRKMPIAWTTMPRAKVDVPQY
jgi:hypothetical protein